MVEISQRIFELQGQIKDPQSAECWEAIRTFGLLAEHHSQRAIELLESHGHQSHQHGCSRCSLLAAVEDEVYMLERRA